MKTTKTMKTMKKFTCKEHITTGVSKPREFPATRQVVTLAAHICAIAAYHPYDFSSVIAALRVVGGTDSPAAFLAREAFWSTWYHQNDLSESEKLSCAEAWAKGEAMLRTGWLP